jgi:SAM-dependent methyltransferase
MTRQQTAWLREYRKSGRERIESSYSLRPEPSVLWFRAYLKKHGLESARLLDLGCGRGRNAMPFLQSGWKVCGLDQVAGALRDFRRVAHGYARALRLVRQDMSRPLPWPDGYFDAVLEITAADNLAAARVRKRFWRETLRVLKPGGRLLSYHFTPADGYYGPLLRTSAWRRRGRLFDRRAGMYFRFYNFREIVSVSRGRLAVERRRHYHYPGPMFGKRYQRDLQAVIFRKQERAPVQGKSVRGCAAKRSGNTRA